jgi:hypothetical protein
MQGIFAVALATVTAVAATAGTAAAAPHRVAVIPSVEVNVDAARAEALTGTLADAIRERLDIDAIGGSDVMRRLPASGLPEDCVADPKCIADLGARLEADQLLFMVIVQVGDTIQLDSTWAEVASGKTIARPMIKLDADARAGKAFTAAAQKLLPDTPLRATSTNTVVIREHGGEPATTPRTMTTTTWITGGVAVVGLGVGIGLGLSTRSDFNRCDNFEHACTDDEISSIHSRALLADLTGGLGLAAGIATAVLYWRSGGETIAVTPTPGGAAVTLGGRF